MNVFIYSLIFKIATGTKFRLGTANVADPSFIKAVGYSEQGKQPKEQKSVEEYKATFSP